MTAPALRRGLPRIPGGEPWPPEGVFTPPAAAEPVAATVASAIPQEAPAAPAVTTQEQSLRQGLPRVPGGEPWPPAAAVAIAAAPVTAATAAPEPAAAQPAEVKRDVTYTDVSLRRGLPRVPGGQPWPEITNAQVAQVVKSSVPVAPAAPAAAAPVATAVPTAAPAAAAPVAKPAKQPAQQAKQVKKEPAVEKPAWLGKAIAAGIGVLALLVVAVFAARGFMNNSDFTQRYTGVAPMPDNAPVGLPAWLGWSHFFNMFLMVMIIRTGLQIRGERKPPAFFTSKSGKKVSLTIWFHTSLDLLWLLNGAVFIVLLFATGQWMRIVPTSWEIFPNMASAAIQYLSLDWPAENGWIHYNALQQVAYFITVFIAAPLAAATGFRMSNWWPKKWTFFPVEIARKLHFPTMLYFVLFIIGHVFLVFATGVKKNLGHMFAASPDGGWLGIILFLVAVLVTVGAAFAAKPLVLAQIARPFGEVTNR
ncbi:hypothetical protein CKALI_08440 [Corynebacterium kalinowskii]|uniref:Uncharacterized protein n=1 Tax=Corynebacterium kalinowskii TaxID=2675216 RepID=A0A6B8W5D7_9CORY|nr:cytochrome b/b6 domain-containing protein [Corynebacterium kalinowskii]QGU02548.1 hypothetical protein CKALI_08440 [Corynebacterium kalinowskii]